LAFGETTSSRLIESVDDFIDLSAEKNKFLIGNLKTKFVSKKKK